MFNNRFFASNAGHAALASIGAMIIFAILSTMRGLSPDEAMLVGMMGTDLA